MNKIVLSVIGLCIFILRGSLLEGAEAQGGKPNFVVILTDDQGWSDMHRRMDVKAQGAEDPFFETPNMDRLVQQGMSFSSGYSSHTTCTPTRRSLLCGMTPARQRGTEFRSSFRIPDHLTIPKALGSDYICGHFGKWGEFMGCHPREAGYAESDGETGNPNGNQIDRKEKDGTIYDPYFGDETIPTYDPNKFDPKLSGAITQRALKFIETHQNEPFYLQASFYAVHRGVEVKKSDYQRLMLKAADLIKSLQPEMQSTNAGFAGMLLDLDRAVGSIVNKLDQTGIRNHTYVFLVSDNGGDQGNPMLRTRNYPLRGWKHTVYEGGVRVPFMVSGPGIKPGSNCPVPVSTCDLLPTVAKLSSSSVPIPSEVDGGDLSFLLANQDDQSWDSFKINRATPGLVFHEPNPKKWGGFHGTALRQGDYKYVVTYKPAFKKIQGQNMVVVTTNMALYNLKTDLSESKDLSDQEPAQAEKMRSDLFRYMEKAGADPYVNEGKPTNSDKKSSNE